MGGQHYLTLDVQYVCMARSSLVLCSIIPRYCIILLSVTPVVAPNISSIEDRSQLILLNSDSIPEN